MRFEVAEHRDFPGQWHAEAFTDEGAPVIAMFVGVNAERRARAYAQLMNDTCPMGAPNPGSGMIG